MNGTPRLPSAFPVTPKTNPAFRGANSDGRQTRSPPIMRPLRRTDTVQPTKEEPLIPFDVLDAPAQRAYVVACYIGLTAWRLYNAYEATDERHSTALFLQWMVIDAVFFMGVPLLKVPWLRWSFLTILSTWVLHAIANAFLMYQIPIPLFAWLGALTKFVYDRELAISEHRVKPGDILRNESILLGKQIIHILPEGSAVLNPDKLSFCLDSTTTSIDIPIQINQTVPISIELVRHDLDSGETETIVLDARTAKKLKAEADKAQPKSQLNTPRLLKYPVHKRGLYQLKRVVDQSKLDVRKRSFDVVVVACPRASISSSMDNKCTGDLSDVSLKVTGVPPFKVRYNKRINHQQFSSISQMIQPTDLEQYVPSDGQSNVVLDPRHPQLGWTQSATVSVDINESLHQNGTWSYTIEEVEDGLNNKVIYGSEKHKHSQKQTSGLTVHNRPRVSLEGCDGEHFLRVAKEDSVNLPVRVQPVGRLPASDWPLQLRYSFSLESAKDIPAVEESVFEMGNDRTVPRVSKAGRYNIEGIASQFCQGEVSEPSSCLVYNPPEPNLSMETEDIFDKCAGNPIGMIVNLDFTGTPPFKVRYTVTHRGSAMPRSQQFNSMRGQIEFREKAAGEYIYQIHEIEDDVYGPISLKNRALILKQTIRPPATASFADGNGVHKACLGQPVSLPVRLFGDGPWHLDYEIVHGGKRKKQSIKSDADTYAIVLPEQTEGGRYSVVLTGVKDKTNCRTALKDERHVEIRPERPHVSFGDVEGKRSVHALEGKSVQLPVRLKGLAPWTIEVQNQAEGASPHKYTLKDPNAIIAVTEPGTYELVSVHDTCPGIVDLKANTFTVSWITRPTLEISDTGAEPQSPDVYRKSPVCEGDESSLALRLSGNPAYHIKYQIKAEPVKGQNAVSNKAVSVASSNAFITFDTAKAGEYTYTFTELSDDRYGHDKGRFRPFSVRQQVFAPPTAKFANPGKTYGYCKDESITTESDMESENIPLTLTGTPPFSVEIAITHHGVSPKPEIVRIKDILSSSYSWSVSHATLALGTHTIQLRSVKDANGCQSIIDRDPSSVRISVSSPPTIIPLESHTDYCVGDHVSFSLSGQAPFEVFYTFQDRERKARVTSNEFRRIAELAGDMVITGISDAAMGNGKCKARKNIGKTVHPYPSVKISRGQEVISDIHEGGEVEILFEFTGTPPFEFTFTRSTNHQRGKKPQILETRHDSSNDYTKTIHASDEGTYEVIAIKDRFCAYSRAGSGSAKSPGNAQKLLTY